ncbi:MAG: hypothetical protein JW880_04990 [Candidatus Thermoplasmatota archaeon]|nr:hypothetical protein [Candidatus Thermoplasmatota archaeon]
MRNWASCQLQVTGKDALQGGNSHKATVIVYLQVIPSSRRQVKLLTQRDKPYEPDWYRIYAALLYLQRHRDKPLDFLKLSHIEGSLRSNHPETKKLVAYLMKEGLASKKEEDKTYYITREGEEWLHKATPVFDRFYRYTMQTIRERIR